MAWRASEGSACGGKPVALKEKSSFSLKRLWPVLVLAAGFALFKFAGGDDLSIIDQLQQHRQSLVAFVNAHQMISALGCILCYAVVVAFSLPVGLWLTVAAGFLFGTWFGGMCVAIGATCGATALFLIARSALGDQLRARAGPYMRRFEQGFQEDQASYMLILRLVPLFPFWLVNLVPAFLGVRLRTYVWTTAIGILPGTFAFAQAGTGLGSILDQGGELSVSSILTPDMIGALVALAVVAAIPVFYKRWKGRKQS